MCDDGFDNTAANAICSDLGYKSSGSEWSSEYNWVIQSGYIIKLDDVNCRSKSWSSCTYSLYNDCSHYEDVFLRCVGTGSEGKFFPLKLETTDHPETVNGSEKSLVLKSWVQDFHYKIILN